MGEPDREWQRIFDVALETFNAGYKVLRAGVTAGELDKALTTPIKEAGYHYTHPAFHALGLRLEEPIGSFPAQLEYKPNHDFVIQENLVMEIEPQVCTVDCKKGLSIGIPALVTGTGYRLLSQKWNPRFIVI